MASNHSERQSSSVYEEYEHALFRLLMHQVAEQEGKELQLIQEKLKSEPDSSPRAEALERFTAELDAHLLRQQAAIRKQRIRKLLRSMTVAAVALCFVFFTAMATVQAFRSRVMNLLMEIQPEYTVFRLQDDAADAGRESMIVNWKNAYVPTYIPEGYQVGSISITEATRKIVYEQGDSSIVYSELSVSGSPVIDSENASRLETVNINGHDGTLVQKDGMITIIWTTSERLFVVQAWTDSGTALKVARGVKFQK